MTFLGFMGLAGVAGVLSSTLAKAAGAAERMWVVRLNRRGHNLSVRPFTKREKAEQFQDNLAKKGVASMLVKRASNGSLEVLRNVAPQANVSGLEIEDTPYLHLPTYSPTRYNRAYTLPHGEMGTLRTKDDIDRQGYLRRFEKLPREGPNVMPFYDRDYGVEYDWRSLPPQATSFRGRGYNLVNIRR